MKFSVAIYAAPSSATARTALEFVRSAIASGHQIHRLFFFNEGAGNGALSGSDADISHDWAQLVTRHALDAVVCVNSAQKLGISIDGKSGRPLREGFVIGGLGQLIDGAINTDRFVTFG